MNIQNSPFYSRAIAPRVVSCLCGLGAIKKQRRRLVPHASGCVLEIGIGSGRNLPFYDPEKVSKVIGIDPDPTMLKLGRGRFQSARVEIDVIQGSADSLPIEDRSIDTALITYTLCSLPNPAAALAEIRRVLRPGGKILFCEHGRSQSERTAEWQDRLNPVWCKLAAGCNINRDAARLLRDAGFKIAELEQFSLTGIPDIIGSHYVGTALPN